MKEPKLINNFKTTNWSGGTTTELFIFPPTAEYSLRNFDFRLSTAKVIIDKSEFTSLPNVSRKIMVLEGNIELTHHEQYSKKLKPFEQDAFKGHWKTSCKGTCTDFNLMTTGNTTGNLEAITIDEKDTRLYQPKNTDNWLFIYIYIGQVVLKFKNTTYPLSKGDLFMLNDDILQPIEMKGIKNSTLIFTTIKTN